MVGDDQVEAQLPGSRRRFAAPDPAVDRHDERHPVGVQAVDCRRLQTVPISQPLRDEVHDVAAEQLQRAPQDHRRGDAVDVVVAVDRDALVLRDRALEPFDRASHVREREGVVEVFDGRVQKAPGTVGIRQPPKAQQPRDDGVHAERRRQRGGLLVVAREVIPEQRPGHDDRVTVATPIWTLAVCPCL
jgi:hypothetical protein